jgi:outer membrane protein assembly factor BamB
LFVASGEAIHALDAGSGSLAWRQPTGVLTAPPLVYEGWVVTATAGDVWSQAGERWHGGLATGTLRLQ